jgi:iron complex transport system substrate-binding protein
MSIASLIPSATEIAFALGLGDDVAGVTFECDYQPDPRVGRAVLAGGLDPHGRTAAEIDALVRERVASGDDLYRLDEGAFRAVDPDAADIVTLDPHTLEEIFDTIDAVGATTDRADRVAALVASLRDRLAAVSGLVADRSGPRVFMLEWPDLPFVGHRVPEMVTVAGATAVLARSGARSVATTWPDVAAVDPDVVVVASCGFDGGDPDPALADRLR